MNRVRLPNTRPQISFPLNMSQSRFERFTVSIGGDGQSDEIREIFVSGLPSPMLDILRDGAILISLALQCGCPLETIAKALTKGEDDAPATRIGDVVAAVMAHAPGAQP